MRDEGERTKSQEVKGYIEGSRGADSSVKMSNKGVWTVSEAEFGAAKRCYRKKRRSSSSLQSGE